MISFVLLLVLDEYKKKSRVEFKIELCTTKRIIIKLGTRLKHNLFHVFSPLDRLGGVHDYSNDTAFYAQRVILFFLFIFTIIIAFRKDTVPTMDANSPHLNSLT